MTLISRIMEIELTLLKIEMNENNSQKIENDQILVVLLLLKIIYRFISSYVIFSFSASLNL